ncbi:hypothetical protein OQI89_10455 [Lentilactobacillus diolivorans]|uniref:Uncharacterized protein n=2 Tax=Lentilactobacillus diolivorans TaxID=179838 RepID=A0A0R1SES6_9LACO|nr:hypothetical protein [Lentilactobacillus diolivorans]KRL67729.1 hypothetical protein FC85_GL002585 [Lentilactobacillus diolivorans DSM 14421]MDH5106271.1 hypothetical protein [Lentilactobacillus diolivorans]GEP22998.1 hypothetical protein LDI01_05910 [Lentilactobacillus diolivorans]
MKINKFLKVLCNKLLVSQVIGNSHFFIGMDKNNQSIIRDIDALVKVQQTGDFQAAEANSLKNK